MRKTIVELDLKEYSKLARQLEENLSVEVVALLNKQIQGFVDAGLKAVKIPRGRAVLGTAGDNAFVVFDQPEQGHRFARAVYEAARAHNTSKTEASAKRWFRIGASTGEIVFSTKRGKRTVDGGITIANAVRLEAAAKPGEFLVDVATFQALPAKLRREYGPEETVQGKHLEEQFQARRCVMLEGAPAPDSTLDSTSGSADQPKSPNAQTPKARHSALRPRSSKPKATGMSMKIGKVTGQVIEKQVIKGDQNLHFGS
jgi:class 3 adenylate cyclase